MCPRIEEFEAHFEHYKKTEKLLRKINKIRTKRLTASMARRYNHRIVATLTHALNKAEQELQVTQSSKVNTWEQDCGVCDVNKMEEANGIAYLNAEPKNDLLLPEMDLDGAAYNSIIDNIVGHELVSHDLPELDSFDLFMSELSTIKVPLER